MNCFQCGKDAFLIRGLCETCAPELHANNKAWMQFIAEANAEFEKTTGKKALEHWEEFEEFLDTTRTPQLTALCLQKREADILYGDPNSKQKVTGVIHA